MKLKILILFLIFISAVDVYASDANLSTKERKKLLKEYALCSAYFSYLDEQEKQTILNQRAINLLDYRNKGDTAKIERRWSVKIKNEKYEMARKLKGEPTNTSLLINKYGGQCESTVAGNPNNDSKSRENLKEVNDTSEVTESSPGRSREDRKEVAKSLESEKSPTNNIQSSLVDTLGLVGEWRGYYNCERGWKIFMRLKFAPGSNQYNVRFESSSGLQGFNPSGELAMKGTVVTDTRVVTLQPTEWKLQPKGIKEFGFEGQLQDNNSMIAGKVTGNPQCKDFSVTKRQIIDAPVNSDGLLFHYVGRKNITATVDDCRTYAEWLAEGKEILGNLFSGVRDSNKMRSVLGKDFYQWGDNDYRKMQELSRYCKSLLEAQQDAEISELISRVNKVNSTWSTRPLMSPRRNRNGTISSTWLSAEQFLMANEQQLSLVDINLAEVAALPPTIESLHHIDALIDEIQSRKTTNKRFKRLTRQEKKDYVENLTIARNHKATAIVNAITDSWSMQSQSYSNLEQIEQQYLVQQTLLEKLAPLSADSLETKFNQEAAQRANVLWPDVLKTTLDKLHALTDSDLSKFEDLRENRKQHAYLIRFYKPTSSDSYFAKYQKDQKLYVQTVEHMIDNSINDLSEWIAKLPPSATTNHVLKKFSQDVFGQDKIPEQYNKLRNLVSDKKQSYNPDQFLRPDIVLALQREHWSEVRFVGLEDLAYLWTSLRTIKNHCPRVVPRGEGPLLNFSMSLARDAVDRVMEGKVKNQAEASRAFMLFANNAINQPGCVIDQFGTITGCTTQEDYNAGQDAIMTSSEAHSDMKKLLSNGCGEEGAGGYVQKLSIFAKSRYHLPSAPKVKNFWQYLESH